MYWSMSKIQKTGALFIMIFLSWVTAFDEAKDDKTQFNGEKFKEENKRKRAESSNESDEPAKDKVASEDKEPKDSDESEDVDTSGSVDSQRLSTKGISPDEFEPERSPSFHGRINSKSSDSE
ncbi:transcriptional regulator ATRX homolog isoform X4 [Maniola jurtina]|uniref:transcriptional regulator ATRX homolog isoform X4 n=1 Tax=Maniola jurtina TaxID=191418 RepID=UPI001E6890D2|nr:transcriptional regulator ATRX homolog isoform X4 [Maniola jurtina]